MRDTYLSTGQLAALVDRSPATIRRYEAAGVIPASRRDPISNRRYWPAGDAETIRRQLEPVVSCTGRGVPDGATS